MAKGMSKARKNMYCAICEYERVCDWDQLQDAIANNTLVVSFCDVMNRNLAKNIMKELDKMEREDNFFEKHGMKRLHSEECYRVVRHSVEVQLQRELDWWANL